MEKKTLLSISRKEYFNENKYSNERLSEEKEEMCVRSFHGRIPPGLEAAGGLNGGKGGDGRRPRNMGGARGIWEGMGYEVKL